MRKPLKYKALTLGPVVAFAVGCLIPQDMEPMNEVRPVNRPPAFDLEQIHPSEPVVHVNTGCPEDPVSFEADVIDLDIGQELMALWFWNYDVRAETADDIRPPLSRRVPPTGDTHRTLAPFNLPARDDPGLNAEGVHSLEVFVVESDALIHGAGDEPPFYRHLRDCEAEGYPEDCVSTHPAVMRWTVVNSDEGPCD